MTSPRPKALVTAAVSGPGLDLLHELADLVLDSWLDQPRLRIYNAEQLAERVAAEGASIVVVESDNCGPALYEQPIIAVCSCRGDPTNVDVPAATRGRCSRAARPGPQRRRCGRAGGGAALRRHSRRRPGRPRRPRRARSTGTGRSPTSATGPGSWPADGRPVGLGAVGRALRWRLQGFGMDVLAYDPYAADATSSFDELLARSDVISIHAPVTEETTGLIDADAFAKMRDGVVVPEHRPGQDPRHGRRWSLPWPRARSGRRGWTTSRASTWHGPSADDVPPGGADAPYRRRHLRHREQPHQDDR